MLRVLLIVILAAAAVIAVLLALRMVREARIDWPGVAFIVLFVGFAVLASERTGIGSLF